MAFETREVEVRPGATPDDPYEVRDRDSVSGKWSSWNEQGEFIKRIRGQPGYRETVKLINEMTKADRERDIKIAPSLTLKVIEEPAEDMATRLSRLRKLLHDKPDMTLARLRAMSSVEMQKLYLLARKMLEKGQLITLPNGALSFPGEGPQIPESVHMTAETAAREPEAEEVLDIAPALEDVPTVTAASQAPEMTTKPNVLEISPSGPASVSEGCEVKSSLSLADSMSTYNFRKLSMEHGEEAAQAAKREEVEGDNTSHIDWSKVDAKKIEIERKVKNGDPVDALLLLARQVGQAEFFHNAGNAPFARVAGDNHHEVKAVCEQDFSDWLKYRAVKATGKAPKKEPLNQAIDTIAVLARFEGAEREVYIRKGEHDGAFYYDLCNDRWQAIRITSKGWEIVNDPPVMFRRFDKMRPQAVPLRGKPEALDELVRLVNMSNESRRLLKAHIVASFVPHVQQYNAFFLGPQGSTKSTGTDIFKAIVDPGTDNRDSLPTKVDDLDLHLSKRCVASYDNISKINADISDTLTRASRGSSSRRALFTNNDENNRSYSAQIVLNAIGLESGVRPDLLDRTVLYICEVVAESQRKGQEEVDKRIEELIPYALGAALDLLVKAIPIHKQLRGRKGWSPRLKDSYLWMMAITKAIGKGTLEEELEFETAFKDVIERRDSDAMEGDPLAVAIEHVASQRGFVGTATQLHEWINDPKRGIAEMCHIDTKDRGWPRSGIALGIHLPRIIAPLRSRKVYVHQCYKFELDKAFDAGKLKDLDRPKADITSYREQERMIIISTVEVRRGVPSSPGA